MGRDRRRPRPISRRRARPAHRGDRGARPSWRSRDRPRRALRPPRSLARARSPSWSRARRSCEASRSAALPARRLGPAAATLGTATGARWTLCPRGPRWRTRTTGEGDTRRTEVSAGTPPDRGPSRPGSTWPDDDGRATLLRQGRARGVAPRPVPCRGRPGPRCAARSCRPRARARRTPSSRSRQTCTHRCPAERGAQPDRVARPRRDLSRSSSRPHAARRPGAGSRAVPRSAARLPSTRRRALGRRGTRSGRSRTPERPALPASAAASPR